MTQPIATDLGQPTRLRVAHVIDSLARGGAERMLIEIACALTEAGVTSHTCVTRSATDLAPELPTSSSLLVLHRRRTFDMVAMFRLRRWLSQTRTDLLHVHSRSTMALLALLRVTNFIRLPVVMHDHYGSIGLDSSVPFWFKHAGQHQVGQYVGVSEELASWARTAGLPGNRVHVIRNGFRLSKWQEVAEKALPTRWRSTPLKGLVVANLRAEKGIHLLLDALEALEEPGRFVIDIAGSSADKSYAAECRDRIGSSKSLSGVVRLIGRSEAIHQLARDADFGLVPSISESGPLVLGEMLAAGLPVVGTKTGEIAGLAASEGIEGMIEPGDPALLAREVKKLLRSDLHTLRARSQQSRRFAEVFLDIQRVVPAWLHIYRSALTPE